VRCAAAIVLACAAGAASPRVALAEDSAITQADKLFQQGRKAAERGDYVEACLRFEDSFRLDPGVGTLVNLGDCEEHKGDLERSLGYYHTALSRMAPGDDRIPHVRERIAGIEQRAARLTLHLAADAPAGTVVTVDGALVRPRSEPMLLAKGVHPVLVTAVGYRGARYSVDVAEGESRELGVSPGAPLESVIPGADGGDVPAGASARASRGWMRGFGIALVGAATGALWVGSLAGLEAIDRRDVQRDNCNAQNACNAAGVAAANEGATWATVSTATFVVGGVLLGAGVVMLVLSFVNHATPTAAATPAPRHHLAWSPLGLEGSF
jgi:hypothetical protein